MVEAEHAGYRSGVSVGDLKHAPTHQATVADRIWNAWWRPNGASLNAVEVALRDVLTANDFPSFTLVASEDGRFLGTVTVIESDIAARPGLGPCIAALWVEGPARGRGIANMLVAAACRRLADGGSERVYLAAKPFLRGYYAGRGWSLLESDVGDDGLDVFVRALP